MNKYTKFIEFSSSLPCVKKQSYRSLNKSSYRSQSYLSYNLIGNGLSDFVFFTTKYMVLRVYQKDRNQYSHLLDNTTFRNWEIEEDTSNWYEISINKINQTSEPVILDLIKQSYDNLYQRNNKKYDLDFFKKVFSENLEKHEVLDWAVKYKHAEQYKLILDSVRRKSIMLIEKPLQKIYKGSSKLGGQPDLPANFKWPTCEGKPLTFMAQLDLSEIKSKLCDNMLPEKGFIYFFSAVAHIDYDKYAYFLDKIDESDTNKVYYFDIEKSQLKRQNNYYGKLNEVALDIDYADSYPLFAEEPVFESYDLSDEEIELLTEISDLQHMATYSSITMNYMSIHSMFAYEIPVQELGSYDRVLLQTTSSENTGMDWGDCGIFFFYIREQDLINLNFDNVYSATQCG